MYLLGLLRCGTDELATGDATGPVIDGCAGEFLGSLPAGWLEAGELG